MNRVLLLLALLFVSAPSVASAQTFDAMLSSGNEAFFRADYESAITSYTALTEAGVDDPDVRYNLGVSYARAGQHGRAIAEFERALRLRPSDAAVSQALQASRSIVGRRHAERDGEATIEAGAPFGEALFSFLSEDALALVVLALTLTLSALLASLFVLQGERARIGVGVAAPLVLLTLLVTGGGLLSRRGAFAAGAPGVIVGDDVALHEGPREASSVRAQALEGERAEIIVRDGNWARVKLGGGREGWLAAREIEAL
jgi:tetratricopeptide (TPR) repeat protein